MSKWPMIPLKNVSVPVSRQLEVMPGSQYRTIGVRWWGEGAYERKTIDGSETRAKKLTLVKKNDLIINKIWVRHGSTAVASEDVDGCAASNEFPTFTLNEQRIIPRWMHWICKTQMFWNHCDALSMGTSGKNRIKPEKFLTINIPLPPLLEQQKLVEWIDDVATRVEHANYEADSAVKRLDNLLMSAFHAIAEGVSHRPLEEIAPLTRRPVAIDPGAEYPGISTRSFGRGTFHNPPLLGSEITWQKPYEVKAGDILVSNIKAWEGAIAVVSPEDDGRFGSHRYLTFACKEGVATPRYVCFYLLSPEGLFHVGEASPGSADRNRTTGSKAMQGIPVPVPKFERQLWFDQLYEKVETAKVMIAQAGEERNAILPSVLNQVFGGGDVE